MCRVAECTKTCANCAHAVKKAADQPCGDCLTHEMATKEPYTKWEARK